MMYHLLKLMILTVSLTSVNLVSAQRAAKKKADADTAKWRYEIQCINVASEGSYVIKVFSFSKNKNVAIEQSKKNAVHGIIFRGIPQSEMGCVRQSPLSRHANLEEMHQDYFERFFAEGGDYMKFVTLTTDGAVAAEDRFRVGKNEYKIGIYVSVDVKGLRKELEAAGIIKKLSSGF